MLFQGRSQQTPWNLTITPPNRICRRLWRADLLHQAGRETWATRLRFSNVTSFQSGPHDRAQVQS